MVSELASDTQDSSERSSPGSSGAAGRSLYRRHRPRSFDRLVGQDAIARTLSNAVEQGRVHHAYLFVGSRGTGKTSSAKILAASLNCEQGPTAHPCGRCNSCVAIAQASSLDVVEMDAASNNSVEDIRELRESIAFAPVAGRYKVYILDEAHMLTQAAWNAFLKTLEEPPPTTVFVLATTEAQKVPATVVDRCHRFDFRRPGAEQIIAVLREVCAAEGFDVPVEALAAIARAATGSFRDALGTLEQIVTYSGPQVSVDDVLAVLGVVDSQLLEEMIDAAGSADPAAALIALGRCLEQGRDPAAVLSGLESRARELMLVQALSSVPAEISLTPEHDARLAAQAERISPRAVIELLEGLAAAREAMRGGADARTHLELALAKVAGLGARDASVHQAATSTKPAPQAEPAVPLDHIAEPAESPVEADGLGVGSGDGSADALERADPVPAGAQGIDRDEDAEASDHDPVSAGQVAAVVDSERTQGKVQSIEQLRALWPEALAAIRAQNALLGALIAEAQPVGIEGNEITLAFAESSSFAKRKAEDRGHVELVTGVLRQLAGRPLRLAYELRPEVEHEAHAPDEEALIERLMSELDAEEIAGEPSL